MHRPRIRVRVVAGLGWGLILIICVAAAQPPARPVGDTYAGHTRAVEAARAGHYDEGLVILRALLREFPDDYPLNRDFILISTWKGDCDAALERFARVRSHAHFEPYFISAVADCAVKRARAGGHDAALSVLGVLEQHEPENYALRHDIIVIHTWKGECRAALERYERLRARPAPEPYFAIAVADCLLADERPKEAVALLQDALAFTPGDPPLQHALQKAQAEQPLADRDHGYREVVFELSSDDSDQGLREWRSHLELSTHVAPETRVYARYLLAHSDDKALSAGNLDRAGAGLRYGFSQRWRGDVEVSGDTQRNGQSGVAARVFYEPRESWRSNLGYTNFAEDLPLRARVAGVEATRWDGVADYHSLDYVWSGRVSANAYDFSDTNRRESMYATLGYAYEMLPYREQRVYVEGYRSTNTLDSAPYFNPRHDRSLGVVQRTDFVHESRYKRHVDRLYLAVSVYDQEDFGTHGKWSMKYEQDYDFDEFSALVWEVTYAHNVYDGAAENETRMALRYLRRF